jgi:hypothetical protein
MAAMKAMVSIARATPSRWKSRNPIIEDCKGKSLSGGNAQFALSLRDKPSFPESGVAMGRLEKRSFPDFAGSHHCFMRNVCPSRCPARVAALHAVSASLKPPAKRT